MPAAGTGRTGAKISSASHATAARATSARTTPIVARLTLVCRRLPVQRELRLRDLIPRARPRADVRLIDLHEDAAEAAVPFGVLRRVGQRVLAGKLLRDRAVDARQLRYVGREECAGAGF